MLRRAPAAEPGVVRRVEDEIGAMVAVDDLARKDDLVANLQPRAAEGAEVERAGTRSDERRVGQGVSVRVDLGGRRIIQKNRKKKQEELDEKQIVSRDNIK